SRCSAGLKLHLPKSTARCYITLGEIEILVVLGKDVRDLMLIDINLHRIYQRFIGKGYLKIRLFFGYGISPKSADWIQEGAQWRSRAQWNRQQYKKRCRYVSSNCKLDLSLPHNNRINTLTISTENLLLADLLITYKTALIILGE